MLEFVLLNNCFPDVKLFCIPREHDVKVFGLYRPEANLKFNQCLWQSFLVKIVKYFVVNRRLLYNSITFVSSSVEATILDKWSNADPIFPYLEKSILVYGHVKSRDKYD